MVGMHPVGQFMVAQTGQENATLTFFGGGGGFISGKDGGLGSEQIFANQEC